MWILIYDLVSVISFGGVNFCNTVVCISNIEFLDILTAILCYSFDAFRSVWGTFSFIVNVCVCLLLMLHGL